MLTSRVYLSVDGSVAELKQDFSFYQGQFQNILLNVYIPTEILSPVFYPATAGSAVKIACQSTNPNGKKVLSQSRYLRYVKKSVVNGIEYALFERALPQEFTTYSGTSTMIINAVIVGEEDTVTRIVTSQTVNFSVAASSNIYSDAPIDPTDLELINSEISSLQDTKQDKTDILLETDDKTVVGAINELNETSQSNENRLNILEPIVNENTEDIQDLKELILSGETFVGTLTTDHAPTAAELNDFVQTQKTRPPKVGDVVIVILQIEGATDKNFKYIYNGAAWSNYEIPPTEPAGNGSLGIVKGNFGTADTTQISIVGGEIKGIYANGEEISTKIPSLSQKITNIENGTTTVGKADRAIKDGNGNTITSHYLTNGEGATKQFVKDYSLPKIFNKALYFSSSGLTPVLPSPGIAYTATSVVIGYTTIATASYTVSGEEMKLYNRNSVSANVFILLENSETDMSFRLTLSAKGKTLAVSEIIARPVLYQELHFDTEFTSLTDEEFVSISDGDIITAKIEVFRTSSFEQTYTIYGGGVTCPSRLLLNVTALTYLGKQIPIVTGDILESGQFEETSNTNFKDGELYLFEFKQKSPVDGNTGAILVISESGVTANILSILQPDPNTTSTFDQLKQTFYISETSENAQRRFLAVYREYIEDDTLVRYIYIVNIISDSELNYVKSVKRPDGVALTKDSDGSVTIPYASSTVPGVAHFSNGYGLSVNSSTGQASVNSATTTLIDSRTAGGTSQFNAYCPIPPSLVDYAIKSAMCDGKGEAWSSAEQRAARVRIGEDVYELIETIYLDNPEDPEDPTPEGVISRDTEPNGSPYNFKKLLIAIGSTDKDYSFVPGTGGDLVLNLSTSPSGGAYETRIYCSCVGGMTDLYAVYYPTGASSISRIPGVRVEAITLPEAPAVPTTNGINGFVLVGGVYYVNIKVYGIRAY